MFRAFTRTNLRVFLLAVCGLIVLNALLLRSPFIGGLLLAGYLFATSTSLGRGLAPGRTANTQLAIGFLSIISTLAILGSAIFYSGPATSGAYLVLVLMVGLGAGLFGRHAETEDEPENRYPSRTALALITLGILSLAAWWFAIIPISITEPTRSIWEFLNPFSITAIGVTAFITITLLARHESRRAGMFFLFATLFSAMSAAVVAYPLGFGFDPFIHRATVAYIAEHGTITPKPFYYIGQYALELAGIHAFSLPLFFVDSLLVPALAAICITISGAIGFGQVLKKKSGIALAALFLLPLSAFVVTTPQALAYVFTAVLLLLSLPRLSKNEQSPPLLVLALVTLAALVTHPLAGIPALLYFSFVIVATQPQIHRNIKILGLSILLTVGAVALPAIFVLQASQSNLEISFTLAHLFDPARLQFTSFFRNQYSSSFDALYLVIDNALWILLALGVVGAYFVKTRKANPALQLPLIAALLWMINYWLLSTTLEFNFLIEYERQNYAVRLLTLSAIFLIPHAGIAIAGMYNAVEKKPRILATALFTILATMTAANVYGAYPRHDNYARSAGFNVGETDFDAVYAINRDAGDDEYIVLANQAVSAAALEAFGFKTYYHDDIFYYPIPTGGALYQYYLEMADDAPTRERAEAAMDVAGVNEAYFVVNDYWWHSEAIIERAKQESDEWFSVGEGAVTIFKYTKNN